MELVLEIRYFKNLDWATKLEDISGMLQGVATQIGKGVEHGYIYTATGGAVGEFNIK